MNSQVCSDWLHLRTTPSYAQSAEIDIPGTKLTVEARFNRTTAYSGGADWAGDLVSKHKDAADINYLLRPNGAEITTTAGHFKTPGVCEIELNKTYHAAMVYDGASLKFYRNGFLLSEVAATGNLIQNNWKTRIGYYEAQNLAENFIGFIDEVRIWDYARSQSDIQLYMTGTLPTPTAQVGLVAYYTFDNNLNKQGNNTYDLTYSPAGSGVNAPVSGCLFVVDSCEIIPAPPDSIILTNNITICAGSQQQIKTLPADTYQWTPSSYLDDPTSANPVARPVDDITYYVEAFISSSNTIIRDSIHIRVERSTIKANEDTTVCAGAPVQMNVTQGTSFNWSPVAGLSDSKIANPVATPLTTTQYIVTGIGDNRCAATDTVLITVLPQPNGTASNDTVICQSATVQLNASGGFSYEWQPSSNFDNPAIPNPRAITATSTIYTVKVTGTNGCSFTDSVNVEVRSKPDFSTSGNQLVCEGDVINLSASGGDSYQWTPSSLVSNPFAATTTATPANATTAYSVHISEAVCNYDTTISMTVTISPKPVVSVFKSNDINCEKPTTELEARGAATYTWTPAAAVENANMGRSFASVDTTTVFNVIGFNNAGCSSTASIVVNVDKGGVPRFVIPNAFSPNGDGKNDCFGIQRWGNAKVHQFAIFNRWGQMVFQTNNASECWDGRMNGVVQAAGGYIYVINATTFCGNIQRRGMLTLIR